MIEGEIWELKTWEMGGTGINEVNRGFSICFLVLLVCKVVFSNGSVEGFKFYGTLYSAVTPL